MYLLNVTLGVWYVFAKLITSLIVLSWNFICNKKWTFKEGFENEIIDNFNPHFKYSIIIPAYNEESRIIKTLNDIADFINKQKQQYEVIVVDDGSTDRTVGVVEGFQKKHRGISIIELSKNQGKGFAVKTGILNSKGENVLFLDADGSTHISEITKLVKHLSNNDIVIGSRKMNESVVVSPKSSLRKILSKLSVAISSLLVKDIKDTQCGFKLMNRKVALHLFSIQKIRKFGFDIEVLALAQFHNYKIAEIPIEWGHVAGSKVNFTRDSLRTFVEVIAIHYNFLTKRY
jgi:dolichyl-phosphate beta-glucosyltransferase